MYSTDNPIKSPVSDNLAGSYSIIDVVDFFACDEGFVERDSHIFIKSIIYKIW
jgi:hypothetical protein